MDFSRILPAIPTMASSATPGSKVMNFCGRWIGSALSATVELAMDISPPYLSDFALPCNMFQYAQANKRRQQQCNRNCPAIERKPRWFLICCSCLSWSDLICHLLISIVQVFVSLPVLPQKKKPTHGLVSGFRKTLKNYSISAGISLDRCAEQ